MEASDRAACSDSVHQHLPYLSQSNVRGQKSPELGLRRIDCDNNQAIRFSALSRLSACSRASI
jgi:hypothetical protein